MRSVLAFILVAFIFVVGFPIVVSASADAAPVHHAKPRHAKVHRQRDVIPGFAVPLRTSDPRWPPVLEDQTPSYDDPSKFGGG
jgi:hypothetical protein